MDKKKVSIVDVAHAAGVSYQTVSRVINNSPSVRESTRKRVREVIDQLDYHPSLSAQTLKNQKTRMIGVIASQTHYAGPLLTLAAIETIARDYGLFITLATVDETELHSRDFQQIEDNFIQLGVEAMVIVAPTEAMVTLAVEAHGKVPRIIITAPEGMQSLESREYDDSTVKFVSIDPYRVSEQIAQALAQQHVSRVYYLSGPQQWRDAYTRQKACMVACDTCGLPCDVVAMDDWGSVAGYERTRELLETIAESESHGYAVWAANDLLAIGAYRALHEKRVHIPQDVKVIGYDDMPGVDSLMPALSTINPNYRTVGSVAMQVVLDVLQYEPLHESVSHSKAAEALDGTALDKAFRKGNMYMVQPAIVARESLVLH